MSYQVLARKWRPHTFEEMVGQEHVLRALINALDNDRLHHAYLFTGTRGVGKTTVARILAKSLNCEQGVSATPCGQCSACTEIDEGRFVDLIEVDAASRTKVEDTRDLLENVQYAPTRGRYKVYLIDEVHMLSASSFNALLKTLEEPPPHVKFLLATTDPQKLPVTVLSRCLQFNLKHLPVQLIRDHLAKVMAREGIEASAAALLEIARAADGSMRDALSLLDQAIAHGGGTVNEKDVRDMLGTIEMVQVSALLDLVAKGDGQQVMQQVAQLAEHGADFNGVLTDLVSLLHRVALAQVVPETIDESDAEADAIRALAQSCSPEDIQLFYQIALIGRRDLPLAPDARSGFEMIVLRMLAFRPQAPQPGITARPVPETATPAAKAQTSRSAPDSGVRETAPADDWDAIVGRLGLRAVAQALATNCALAGKSGDTVRLLLNRRHEQLASDSARQRLQDALARHYGAPVKIDIEIVDDEVGSPAAHQQQQAADRHRQAMQSLQEDEVVQGLQAAFDAEIRPDMVTPLDE